MTDFKKWNKIIKKLTYKHNTFQIFKDYLDIIIDNFTIPDQTPLFQHHERYTEQEHRYFAELYKEHVNIMQTMLEEKEYYDFPGEWWESDQNLTNKDTEQYFTPPDIADLMCELLEVDSLSSDCCTMHDCCCGSGRFALAYHKYRPNDWFFLVDIDEIAVKMTLVNMLFHGMRGVVCHGNALTREVFSCWVVTPSLLEYCGVPYVVPYGKDIGCALSFLPREVVPVNTTDSDNPADKTKKSDRKEQTDKTVRGLDAWLK